MNDKKEEKKEEKKTETAPWNIKDGSQTGQWGCDGRWHTKEKSSDAWLWYEGTGWGAGPPRTEDSWWTPPSHMKHRVKEDAHKFEWAPRTYYEVPGTKNMYVHFDPTIKDPPGMGPERFNDVLEHIYSKKK